jgi:hypothetical protein
MGLMPLLLLSRKETLQASQLASQLATAREGQSLVREIFEILPFPHRLTTYSVGGTNHQLDLQNPDNLARQSTDAGTVVNLKWSFSDSKSKIFNGGWTREQVITDLPASHDIAAAQQHLKKGALRELHWHRVVSLGTVKTRRSLT